MLAILTGACEPATLHKSQIGVRIDLDDFCGQSSFVCDDDLDPFRAVNHIGVRDETAIAIDEEAGSVPQLRRGVGRTERRQHHEAHAGTHESDEADIFVLSGQGPWGVKNCKSHSGCNAAYLTRRRNELAALGRLLGGAGSVTSLSQPR